MKIAFAMINCNRRDGSARAVNEVAERLASRHEVTMFARQVEDLDLNKIRWQKIPGPGWPEVADFWSYHRLANQMIEPGAFDIVHSIGPNTARANVVTIQNIQPAKVAVFRRLGGEASISFARKMTRALYLKVTSQAERSIYERMTHGGRPLAFLPVSGGVERELRAHYKVGSAMVRIVPNAADTTRFCPQSHVQREAWRSAVGLPLKQPLLIFCGGEWRRKGLDFLLKAMACMRHSEAMLFVAGDDPAARDFVVQSESLGIARRVVWGGFRSDVPLALASSDLFVFPSHYEAFSLATIEAAAAGLPVVATRINGTEDFIVPGETGEFVEHDPTQIAAVLDALLDAPTQIRRMGDAARRLVESRYTWDHVANQTGRAYEDFLAQGGRA